MTSSNSYLLRDLCVSAVNSPGEIARLVMCENIRRIAGSDADRLRFRDSVVKSDQ
jgi:hypothetical protein